MSNKALNAATERDAIVEASSKAQAQAKEAKLVATRTKEALMRTELKEKDLQVYDIINIRIFEFFTYTLQPLLLRGINFI